jgi:hypothetical protein
MKLLMLGGGVVGIIVGLAIKDDSIYTSGHIWLVGSILYIPD